MTNIIKIPLIDTPYNTELILLNIINYPQAKYSLDDMSYGIEYDFDSYDNEYYLDSDDEMSKIMVKYMS